MWRSTTFLVVAALFCASARGDVSFYAGRGMYANLPLAYGDDAVKNDSRTGGAAIDPEQREAEAIVPTGLAFDEDPPTPHLDQQVGGRAPHPSECDAPARLSPGEPLRRSTGRMSC